MHVFQRLKNTLSSGIDSLLEDIENHEAVIKATILDVEGHASAVRAHRVECEATIDALGRRGLALDGEARSWRVRARHSAEREDALECVRRMRAAARAQSEAQRERDGQRALLEALTADESAIAMKLDDLRRRCARLRSRQARSEVDRGIPLRTDPDEVLRRWESSVAKCEALRPPSSRAEGTAHASSREEALLVSAELDRLLKEEDSR